MKKGFDRLRGIATASAIGIAAAAGNARAVSTPLPVSALTRGSARWQQIKNTSRLLVNTSGSAFTTNSGILITTGQSGFAINDAALTTGMDNAFDSALFLSIGSNVFKNPDETVDLTGDTIKTDTITGFETSIDVSIDFYFHPTRPLVRALYNFTNTSNIAITLDNILIGGNLGSDFDTTIQGSSDGDNVLLNTDLWLITNNKESGTDPDTNVELDTPVITISRFGSGSSSIPVATVIPGAGNDIFANRYSITVPANGTARILVFAELNRTIAEAKVCAQDFETLDAASSAGLLTGLTIQINEIANYATATGTGVSSNCTHSSSPPPPSSGGDDSPTDTDLSTGALSPASISCLLGLLALSRLPRKNKSQADT